MRLADRMTCEDAALSREVVKRVCGISEDDAEFPDYLKMMESRGIG